MGERGESDKEIERVRGRDSEREREGEERELKGERVRRRES